MSSTEAAAVSDGPYVGPRPFGREHSSLFFGRTREIEELFKLLLAERIVLLYSPSGAGKSSLLQAGVAPLLEAQQYTVLPVMRVHAPLEEGEPGARYRRSALASLEEGLLKRREAFYRNPKEKIPDREPLTEEEAR